MVKDREAYNEYMREYMLEYYYKRKAQALEYLGSHCINCGETENLQFDHIDPELKEFTITKLFSASNERFWAEVDKCQLLCSLCHDLKTMDDQGAVHGGGLSGKKNCSCVLCKAKKAEYMKSYDRKR